MVSVVTSLLERKFELHQERMQRFRAFIKQLMNEYHDKLEASLAYADTCYTDGMPEISEHCHCSVNSNEYFLS